MSSSNQLHEDLIQIVGEAGLLPDDQLNRYTIDGIGPQAVVLPRSTHEIQEVLGYAADSGLSVIPAGSGTKLGVGNPPEQVDLVLSTSRLDQVLEYEPADLTVTVEAGIRLAMLQAKLAEHGQYFSLDPPYADRCTIGGITATNASGPSRLRFGGARDLVLGMRVVQSSGTVVKSGGKVVKNVAGYDLNKLYLGSFGTLGVITEVSLKLQPLPEIERNILLTFADVGEAVNVASEISGSQLLPTFLNLFVNGAPFTDSPEPCLLIGLDGHPETVEWQVDSVKTIAQQNGVFGVGVYEGQQQQELRTSMCTFPEAESATPLVICRANLRMTDVGDFVNTALEVNESVPWRVRATGLMGNGVVYVIFSDFPDGEVPVQHVADTLANLRDAAANVGGNLIVESAPAALKRQIDVWGPVGRSFELMKAIKTRLDPIGLLNVGRFVGGI
jgi:glycolate oxidase FAD binding subunit